MTKEEILKDFKDINFMYNNCSKYDTLEQDLTLYRDAIYGEILKTITDKVDPFEFADILTIAIKDNDEYKYIEIY